VWTGSETPTDCAEHLRVGMETIYMKYTYLQESMNLEDMLSEITQAQKDKHHMTSLTCSI
jgi:hypothetical protein